MEYHKMKKPIVIIHNAETNEVVEREMTSAEFSVYEADQAAQLVKQAEAEAKATAKAALLEQLGITEEQAKLLLS
jgi:hypothetical protein